MPQLIQISPEEGLALEISVFVSETFGQNAYILRKTDHQSCLVVDPGFEVQGIMDYLDSGGYQLDAILNTHGHIDHIAGNRAVKGRYPAATLVIGEFDAHKLSDAKANLSASYGIDLVSPDADLRVSHGDKLKFAGLELETRLTPGHSPGHVVWVCWETLTPLVINGDVLFAGSIGRTDFPDGSFEELEKSIRTQLYTLPDETIVLTGHGDFTTVGQEKAGNPFVSG